MSIICIGGPLDGRVIPGGRFPRQRFTEEGCEYEICEAGRVRCAWVAETLKERRARIAYRWKRVWEAMGTGKFIPASARLPVV